MYHDSSELTIAKHQAQDSVANNLMEEEDNLLAVESTNSLNKLSQYDELSKHDELSEDHELAEHENDEPLEASSLEALDGPKAAEVHTELIPVTEELPILMEDSGFRKYLQEINKFPILTLEQEQHYAELVSKYRDKEAAKLLVASHLRLVIKIANTYRGYGLPVKDIVFEGNIGLMKAVQKFDYTLGNRFSTYAIWWIKAAMQEYILKSWSLVKICTTTAQKKLFFNLNRLKNKIFNQDHRKTYLNDTDINQIANTLEVDGKTVKQMVMRLDQGDVSLNNKVNNTDDDTIELADMIADDEKYNQENMLAQAQEQAKNHQLLMQALASLKEREKEILFARKFQEKSVTLDDLSQKYHISRERVRQIEEASIKKLRQYFQKSEQ